MSTHSESNKTLKFYFAGSISGGRQKAADYEKIIQMLSGYGKVLTEHIGDTSLSSQGEVKKTATEVYERDVAWIDQSDMVIAEVTVVSLGVGYEIGYAEARGTKVICLYQIGAPGRLSSMISGNKNVLVIMYSDLEDLKQKLVPLLVK